MHIRPFLCQRWRHKGILLQSRWGSLKQDSGINIYFTHFRRTSKAFWRLWPCGGAKCHWPKITRQSWKTDNYVSSVDPMQISQANVTWKWILLRILRCIMWCDVSIWYTLLSFVNFICFFVGWQGMSSFSVSSAVLFFKYVNQVKRYKQNTK